MQTTSWLIDKKIMGINVGAELSIGEYVGFARDIISKNEYQRKRVKSLGRTYDLLAKDLWDGCVIPPIVLAVSSAYAAEMEPLIRDAIAKGLSASEKAAIEEIIQRAVRDRELLILDGLQRSLTILGLLDHRDLLTPNSDVQKFMSQSIRIEIYVGISKMGILYRMLTLNTGQTPMSFRHQLEILYHDYLTKDKLPNGIEIVREVDERPARGTDKYKYQDVIDMFYAYSTGSPMPYDRPALVGELQEMRFLETYTYNPHVDEMLALLTSYHAFISRVDAESNNWHLTEGDGSSGVYRPFGATAAAIFGRPQPMSGFGAEVKRLVDMKRIQTPADMVPLIGRCSFGNGSAEQALEQLVKILDQIAARAKKIGEAQRLYFQYAFRSLFFEESDAYLDLSRCWLKAQETYELMH